MTSSSAAYAALRRGTSATVANLVDSRRSDNLKMAVRSWSFQHESRTIPEAYPRDIWPGIENVRATASLDMSYTYELPFGERAVIAGVAAHLGVQTAFELGTFTGLTTAIIAESLPENGVVHTIDQDDSVFPANGFDNWFTSDLVGDAFRHNDQLNHKIVLHRGDIRSYDFEEFFGTMGLVFVDAGHSYDDVIFDSEVAFRLISPSGTIIWDDYHSPQWGVVRALNEISSERSLKRVAGTRLVAYYGGAG